MTPVIFTKISKSFPSLRKGLFYVTKDFSAHKNPLHTLTILNVVQNDETFCHQVTIFLMMCDALPH